MATLVSTVIDKVVEPFRYQDPADVLNGALTTTTTAVVITFDYTVGERSVIEIERELMFVTDWDSSNKIATVKRGAYGSTAVPHADASMVYINPRVHRHEILDYVNMCLIELYPELFDVGRQEITYSGSVIGHALDSDVDEILSLSVEVDSSASHWEYSFDWDQMDNLPAADFANALGIMVRAAQPHGSDMVVAYKKPFVKVTAESDDLEAAAGLADYMTDLPFYFAMSRIMLAEEVDRSNSSDAEAHQRAQDVQSFAAMRTGEWYKARYDDLRKICRFRQAHEVKKIRGAGYGR